MGNLKDINYGVGKYLTADDASSIPDIGTNRVNLDTLNFKLATNNSYALYNMKDGFIEAFEDTSGVDASGSTNELRDSSGKYYHGTVVASTITDFTSTGADTWTCPSGVTSIELLVVAGGGGGGGAYYAGGGGAGGVIHDTSYTVVPGTVYDLTVGAGGSGGGNNTAGSDGSDSVWNVNAEGSGITFTADGGGGGGSSGTQNGASGGSGGGASGYGIPNTGGSSSQTSPSGATGYGNAGGESGNYGTYSGGGGGGASTAGGSSQSSGVSGKGGAGGAGREFTTFSSYGVSGFFAGGGGGGAYPASSASVGGAGGSGGGGSGAKSEGGSVAATAGTGNTGGGGGGGSQSGGNSGGKAGGSGIILIKTEEVYNNLTLVSNAQTAQAQSDTARITVFEHPSTGTTTVNTDIKAYASRDNGTTYTQITLTDDGEYESGKKLLSGSADISGQPAGTSMRYKIETLNQSSSKITRLHGVSLQWA